MTDGQYLMTYNNFMKTFAVLMCLGLAQLILVSGDTNSPVTSSVSETIKYPSDLEHCGTNAASEFSTDFVLRTMIDFRRLYCDQRTLMDRMDAGVCIIDYARQSKPSHSEIKIRPETPLRDVLKKSSDPELLDWPGLRVITGKKIVKYSQDAEFLDTKISPGDFIVVVPIY